MQQKIDTLTSRLKDQIEKAAGYETSISEYASRLSSAEDDIETWKNKVRNREKQLFTYKAERATFLTDQESNRKQIRELKDALDKALGVEKYIKNVFLRLVQKKNPICRRIRSWKKHWKRREISRLQQKLFQKDMQIPTERCRYVQKIWMILMNISAITLKTSDSTGMRRGHQIL